MRVLLVEDDDVIADAVTRGLMAEGFAVDRAADGIDGEWMASENDYDVLILDLMLPGQSGYEVCRRLRARGSLSPILVLTAKDGEYDEADALDLGADDFLSKPFSFVVLLARIRALLRRGPARKEPILVSGDLRLDPATRRCWRGEEEIELTSREFSLTEFLIRHAGEALSRNRIAEHVWDGDLDVDSNVIDVYIGYVRRKLDRPFNRQDIQTIRGFGYQLTVSSPVPGSSAIMNEGADR